MRKPNDDITWKSVLFDCKSSQLLANWFLFAIQNNHIKLFMTFSARNAYERCILGMRLNWIETKPANNKMHCISSVLKCTNDGNQKITNHDSDNLNTEISMPCLLSYFLSSFVSLSSLWYFFHGHRTHLVWNILYLYAIHRGTQRKCRKNLNLYTHYTRTRCNPVSHENPYTFYVTIAVMLLCTIFSFAFSFSSLWKALT